MYGMVAALCVLFFIVWTSTQYEPMPAIGFVLVPAAAVVYLLPALIAAHRQHKSKIAIFALNLLLGWSFLGWALALIWSLTAPKSEAPVVVNQAAPASAADELGKLAELRDKGVLTDEEFEARKKALLS